jgi:hypothetical protein
MTEFVDNGAAVFGRDLVESAVDDGFGPLDLYERERSRALEHFLINHRP